jgi:hypothetical protein
LASRKSASEGALSRPRPRPRPRPPLTRAQTHIRSNLTILDKEGVKHGILVAAREVSPMAASAAAEQQKTRIEFFVEQDLIVNITRHTLVPKHVLLTDKEKKTLLERYRIKVCVRRCAGGPLCLGR